MKTARSHSGCESKEELEQDLATYSATANTALPATASRRNVKRACVGFGAAASAALVGATGIDAAIQYSGIRNLTGGAPGGPIEIGIDLDGVGGVAYNGVPGADLKVFQAGNIGGLLGGFNGPKLALEPTDIRAIRKFSSGEMIGTVGSKLDLPNGNGSVVSAFGGAPVGDFVVNSPGFAGFQLGSGNFGWVRIRHNGPGLGITVIDWAYDDARNHLQAGEGAPQGPGNAVPEPATAFMMGLGLLSMGSAGVRTYRRRKKEAAEKATAPVGAA